MRWKITAGVLLTLALLIPATSAAAAPTGSPKLDEASCQAHQYTDIRELVSIDLETASDTDVLVLATQIFSAANADSLSRLPGTLQERLDGSVDDLRAFLKTELQRVWSIDLEIAATRTLSDAGPNVRVAARNALDNGTIDALLTYLNHGLYIAHAADFGSLKVYRDIRELVSIDLETASDTDVLVLATQIFSAANADSLDTLPGALQARLDGSVDDLRAFLKTKLQLVWSIDLRIAATRTLSIGGPNVQSAAQKALDNGTIDALLAFLNHGLYIARALDCAYQPSASA